MVDRRYCMSSYLMYRYIVDDTRCFDERYPYRNVDISFERTPIRNADELLGFIEKETDQYWKDENVALALSGGIDSAILAKFLPRGTKAYTFRCDAPGQKVIDESEQARYWADICDLDHEVVTIEWKDIENTCDILMAHKGAPIHSIEIQIYIAALEAVKHGAKKFIFGENADIIYGGMNGLLEKDWLISQFVDRYSYIMPYKVLRDFCVIMEPFISCEKNGKIDGYEFTNIFFRQEALGTYHNACETAGIEFEGPYSRTYLNEPIDYKKVRSGNTKYIVREAFKKLYPNEKIPQKVPMPRATTQWMKNWKGPVRDEFYPESVKDFNGDQKWMVYCLERFLNMLD